MTFFHTYLIGAVLQSLHQVVPALCQLLRVRLNALPCCGAFQHLRHILPCLRQRTQRPPFLRHVLLQALTNEVNGQKFQTANLVSKNVTFSASLIVWYFLNNMVI